MFQHALVVGCRLFHQGEIMLIPSINMKRVFELMELEKIRPISKEELDSCISQKEVPDKFVQEMAKRLSNDQGRILVADE